MPPSDVEETAYFDTVTSLAVLFDHGEFAPQGEDNVYGYTSKSIGPHGCRTPGRLIPLASNTISVPLRMGPPSAGDVHAEYEPMWFDNSSDFFPPWDPQEDPPANWKQSWKPPEAPDRYGNHSLPIYSHELLFGSKDAKKDFHDENMSYGNDFTPNILVRDDPKEVEFLGNGMPYPGRWYSRAVILLWPKENREAIELQSKGGRDLKQTSSKKQKRGGSKK